MPLGINSVTYRSAGFQPAVSQGFQPADPHLFSVPSHAAFRGLAPLRAFAAYFIGNALIFFFVFQPLLGREWLPIPALESLVVLIDALMIKFLVSLEVLQGDAYAGVSWFRAVLVSGFGNAASYFVGYIASRKPWEVG